MSAFAIPAVVPAAGQSRRFGGDKLVFAIDGVAILSRTLRGLAAGGAAPLIVVVAGDGGARRDLAVSEGAEVIASDQPLATMLDSVLLGLQAAPPGPVLICPADLPYLTASTVAAVLAAALAAPDRIVVPGFGSRRGHPLLVPASLRGLIPTLDPARGLRALFELPGVGPLRVEVADPGCLRDVDHRRDVG